MSDSVIQARGVGKKYRLGTARETYQTLRESVTRWMTAPFRRFRHRKESAVDPAEFWALKDIDFEVNQGEVVGIIGRNGAGKSTLLKILSRITEPTEGEIDIHGRVGSLLEVGTGFHPELTGRENVFLNGAILGMKRAEITRKFDEIVAFAEVEKFIDSPVKHYSSGMYMRLAFAVAAHLEPEILIVDEVLAVGDAQFQKKCLGKMGEVAKQGRTVLFVSHNLQAIATLCDRGMLLHQGKLILQDETIKVLASYANLQSTHEGMTWFGIDGDDDLSLLRVKVISSEGSDFCRSDQDIGVEVMFRTNASMLGLICAVEIFNQFDTKLIYSNFDDLLPPPATLVEKGIHTWRVTIPKNTLAAGNYRVQFDLGIHNLKRVSTEESHLQIHVENVAGIGRRFLAHSNLIRPAWEWEHLSSEPLVASSNS